MPPERAQKVNKRSDDVPVMYQGLYDRVARGKASHKQAVKCQCLECTCWQRREVAMCTALACPLWLYRPYQDPQKEGTYDSVTAELNIEAG